MIYLIQLYSTRAGRKKPDRLLKIGYTENLDNRLQSYRTSDPCADFLNISQGSIETEKYLHQVFRDFKYPLRSEFFWYDKDILRRFRVESDRAVQIIKDILGPSELGYETEKTILSALKDSEIERLGYICSSGIPGKSKTRILELLKTAVAQGRLELSRYWEIKDK